MYLSFYDLKRNPFQVNTDPEFLWLGEKQRQAMAVLKYGILDNKGFLLLTGDIGTGKTTLINGLVEDFGDQVVVARVPDPGMKTIDFINYISYAFHLQQKFSEKHSFLIQFRTFLQAACNRDQKVLLIIDECQRISQSTLEEVRQLSNIERQQSKLLSIFLVGLSEFLDTLNEPANQAFRQRIAASSVLAPLAFEETKALIQHRLNIAGADNKLFSEGAIRAIYDATRGIPRKINILCDHCLVAGYTRGQTTISKELAAECAGTGNRPGDQYAGQGILISATQKGATGAVTLPTSEIVLKPAGEQVMWRGETTMPSGPQRSPGRLGETALAWLLLLSLAFAVIPSGNRSRLVLLAEQVQHFFLGPVDSQMIAGGNSPAPPAESLKYPPVDPMENPAPTYIYRQVSSAEPNTWRIDYLTSEGPGYALEPLPFIRLENTAVEQRVGVASPVVQELVPVTVPQEEPEAEADSEVAPPEAKAYITGNQDVHDGVVTTEQSNENIEENYQERENSIEGQEEQLSSTKAGGKQTKKEQPIDPGKVIDWLLETRAK